MSSVRIAAHQSLIALVKVFWTIHHLFVAYADQWRRYIATEMYSLQICLIMKLRTAHNLQIASLVLC